MTSDDNTRQKPAGGLRNNAVRATILGLILVPMAVLWAILATDDGSNIALVRNDVTQNSSGIRTWQGEMGNTTDSQYREIAVEIRFLDGNDQQVGEVSGGADVLEPGKSFKLQAPLPAQAQAVQVYSLTWVTGRNDKKTDPPLGPWAPWPFGHVQAQWP